MSEFWAYLRLGFGHILDAQGYDHLLFLLALCAIYTLRDWKRVFIIVTAFTVGHSLTLALATFDVVRLPNELVELLIPVTILITAISNLFVKLETSMFVDRQPRQNYRYLYGVGFGLIHGLGFSTYLRALLAPDASVARQLLAFNVGIELAQLLIVIVFTFLAFIATNGFRVSRHDWNLVFSGAAGGIALLMVLERL